MVKPLTALEAVELYTRFMEMQLEPHSILVPRILVQISTSIRQLQTKEWQKLVALLDFIGSTSPGFPDPRFINSFYQFGAYKMALELYMWLFEKKDRPQWFAELVFGYELPLVLQDLK